MVSLNRAVRDWEQSNEWSSLLKVHDGLVSTSSANASYALPSDFQKLDSPVLVGGITTNLLVVHPSDNVKYLSSDNFVNVLGNDRVGNTLYIHTSTLASGASVQFTYYARAATLATTTSVPDCPDPTFLVQRALYYEYKAKEDGRFPEAKAESDRILARMIENENSLGKGYIDRSIQTNTFGGWRIGRDM
jgi:hypothetical protein